MQRARHINATQITALEELWRTDPKATLADLDRPGVEDVAVSTLMHYEDGYQYVRG